MSTGTMEAMIAALQENTEALNANTAALGGDGAAAEKKPAAKKTPAKKTPAKKSAAKKSKHTADEVRDTVIKVKNEIDEETAKEVISSTGYKQLAEVVADSEKWDDVMELAEQKLAEAAEAEEEEEEDGNGGL